MDIFGPIRSIGKRANRRAYYYVCSANKYYIVDKNTLEPADDFHINNSQIFTFIPNNMVIFSKFTCESSLQGDEIAQSARIFAFEEFSLNPLNEYIIFYEQNRFLSSKSHLKTVYNLYIVDVSVLNTIFSDVEKYIDFAYFAPHTLKILFDDMVLSKLGVFAFVCLVEKSPFLAVFIDGELQYVDEIEIGDLSATFVHVVKELNIDNIEILYIEKNVFDADDILNATVSYVSKIEQFSFDSEIYDMTSLVLNKGFGNQSFNFSTKQRPKHFLKRRSGQFIAIFVTAFTLFFIYPCGSFLFEYRKISHHSQQLAKIKSKEAELASKLEQVSNSISALTAEIKTIQSSLLAINEGVASMDNIKTNRAYGVRTLLLLAREAKRYNVLFDDFCLTPLNIGLKIESPDMVQITSFADSLACSGFAVTIFDIKKDTNKLGYVSRLNMEISGAY